MLMTTQSTYAGRVGPSSIDPALLESADLEVLNLGAALSDSFGLAQPIIATNGRELLQSGCPNPSFQNPCYAPDGASFICCAAGCGNFNGARPTCQGGAPATQTSPPTGTPSKPPPTKAPTNPPPTKAPTNPPPTSAPTNPTTNPPQTNPPTTGDYNPPDNPPMVNPIAAFPVPLGSTATPMVANYCPTAMCFVSDGSRGFCCLTQCPVNPKSYPYCSGDRIGVASGPPTGKPTAAPATPTPTAVIQQITPNPTTNPTQAPVTANPTAAPAAPVTASPTANPTGRDRLFNSYWLIPGNSAPSRNDGWFEVSENLVNPDTKFGLGENAVFFRSLKHHGDHEWELRIGPSGHVYSIKTSTSGGAELVCCQASQTQWMDRVLQSCVSDLRYPGAYTLQQAGSYPQKSPNPFPLYSPNLGVSTGALDRGISVVTLPQQAQIYERDLADKNFWQWVLLQQHLRDIGNGIVELTYVFHNFGPFDLQFVDAPWGGFKFSQFPQYAVGEKTGGYHFEDHSGAWEYTPPADSSSGGWMAFAKTQDAAADAIGIVYAPNQNTQPWPQSLIRFGRLPTEDLNVIEHIHMNQPWEKVTAALPAGGVFYARYYMVLNSVGNIAGAVPDLQQHVSKGPLQFSAAETGFMSVGAPIPVTSWYPIDHPLPHSLPLFLLKYVSTGQTVVSTSPYAFYNTNNGNTADPRGTQYLKFLGWGVKDTGSGAPQGLGAMKLLSQILPQAWFPDPYWGDAVVKADVWVGV
ncbi:hypothetical protein KFL_001630050 [Klebsormidium nitens]|uniref:Uncharacterized protein n=1 Tax=Klebsormidium nitens TaxID=105231 RepID=A0A1Y1I508_KLENI|nr:hypothetical protein KFL_001630050 [Klebsormidium nitens]|eukprot:GAQ83807.1 hypothetical protein KFL_001630050 [Klebsormidium nitens]